MSGNWVYDIFKMHSHYGVHKYMDNPESKEKIWDHLQFRLDFLKEELAETEKAINEKDPEEVIDGLIDLCVVAIGTLDIIDTDALKAWDEVLRANMEKKIGINKSRPNKLGLPDLVKPDGWKKPSHKKNHGILSKEKKV
jgi:predicted HAD superfamily Cof-like phosphohydrolase